MVVGDAEEAVVRHYEEKKTRMSHILGLCEILTQWARPK